MVYDYKEKFSVQGKKCIVTGRGHRACQRYGRRAFGKRSRGGLMDLQKEKLEQAVEEYCKKGYKAHGVAGDLSKKQNWTGCSMRLWNCWEVSWML